MLAAEGPNEPNNFNFNYNGKTCSTRGSFLPCAYTWRLNTRWLKAIPSWRACRHGIRQSRGRSRTIQAFSSLPFLRDRHHRAGRYVFADVANLHNYVKGNGQKTIADNQAWNAESTAGGPWDGLVGEYLQYNLE